MFKIFAGLKGSGKTKHLIEMVNAAQSSTTGNVVCIEQGTKLIHEINRDTRLIDTTVYGVDDWEKLYGFVCGMFACNYDITELYIDSALKICADDVAAFEEFVVKTAKLADLYKIDCIVTASCEASALSENVKGFIK